MKLTEQEIKWWNTLDMKDDYLGKLWFQMFGTAEQRVKQLFIIRKSHKFTLKNEKI